MAKLVKFNRGAGPEYGLLAGSNDDGTDEIVPLNVPVSETVDSRLTEGASPGGGEYVVVK